MKTLLATLLFLSPSLAVAGKITCYVIDTAISDSAKLLEKPVADGGADGVFGMGTANGMPISVTLYTQDRDNAEDHTSAGVYLTSVCAETAPGAKVCSQNQLQFVRANGTRTQIACLYFAN
jgi:hypothetical protein